ncbi:hypothetical protein ACLOJK_015046, partial [Asimina triloba]
KIYIKENVGESLEIWGKFVYEENRTACGLWDPMVGRAPSRCLRPATVAPPAVVPTVGRYTIHSQRLVSDQCIGCIDSEVERAGSEVERKENYQTM